MRFAYYLNYLNNPLQREDVQWAWQRSSFVTPDPVNAVIVYLEPLWEAPLQGNAFFSGLAIVSLIAAVLLIWWKPLRAYRRYWEPAVALTAVLVPWVSLQEASAKVPISVNQSYTGAMDLRITDSNSYGSFMVVATALIVVTGLGLRLRRWSAITATGAITAIVFYLHLQTFHHVPLVLLPLLIGVGMIASAQDELVKRDFLLTQEIQSEREKSELLLLNILPAPIAERLKETPQNSIADAYAEVSVLFADIVDFTPLAASLSAAEIVNLLNRVFSAFDRLAQRHELEKIKTIGDAYMVVGEVPEAKTNHAHAIAQMALEMQATVAEFLRPDGTPLRLRIGINSGPVVAGVIGTNKFIYDLWGDTVNIASRMESQGKRTASRLQKAPPYCLRGLLTSPLPKLSLSKGAVRCWRIPCWAKCIPSIRHRARQACRQYDVLWF